MSQKIAFGKTIVTRKPIIANTIVEGPVWRGLLTFFFPILLGTFFQQAYNTVDAVVVGQFLGKQALAAVSGGSGVYVNLLVGFFVGLSSGSTIIISQFYGAKHEENLSRAVHTAMALSFWVGIGMTAVGVLVAPAAMRVIATPDDIFPLAVTYLRIYFAGVLPMLIYNMGSGILRAFGDSKSPFWILVIGCGANIALDLLCVAVLNMGVAGAAWATDASQFLCMVLTIIKLTKQENPSCRFYVKKMRFTPMLLRRMIVVGLPSGVQSSLYTVSNLIIQSNINALGTNTAAAWAAYGRLDAVFWMIINSFGVALTTFCGQNYGAHKLHRIKRANRDGLIFATISAATLGLLFYFFGRYVFFLFTRDEEVISVGETLLHFLPLTFVTYVPIEVLSGTIRGTGETFKPMIIIMLGVCAVRLAWIFTAVPLHNTLITVVACYPISWTTTSIVFFIYYGRGKWLRRQEKMPAQKDEINN